jgi:Uma2 family endonuclease
MGALPIPRLSVEEYLALDRAAEVPSEYHDGEMFPMVAVSLQHSGLSANLSRRLGERLDGTPCRVWASPLRVRVAPTKFVIPDITVTCGSPTLTDEHQDTLTNPKVIVEILSPSTADYDYGSKFALYRRLESFEEYVLVAQDEPRIEVIRKTDDARWVITTYEGLDKLAQIESLAISLPLAEVYAGVELPPADAVQ